MSNSTRRTLSLVTIMALALVTTTRDASAVEREGVTIGLGGGAGHIACNECKSLSGGGAGVFHLGKMATERSAIVLDVAWVIKEVDDEEITSVVAGGSLQYWVSPRVWVKGGVGAAEVLTKGEDFVVASERGLGFIGGIGVEVLQKQKFTIDLQLRSTTARISGVGISNILGVVGFNYY